MPSLSIAAPSLRRMRNAAARWCVCGALLVVCAAPRNALAKEFPDPVGHVNDFAGVLTDDAKAQVTALLEELEQKTTAEVAVVTVRTTAPYDYTEYANRLFRQWGIGKRGKDNGVLLLLAIEDRKLRIEVGYGLEGIIPDGVAGRIRDDYLVPNLKAGKYGEAVWEGVNAIAAIIARDAGVTLGQAATIPASPTTARHSTMPHSWHLILTLVLVAFGWLRGLPPAVLLGLALLLFVEHDIIGATICVFLAALLWLGIRSTGKRGNNSGWVSGSNWSGGGFSGGGFGGFGGGSSGGGGAGGGW